MTLLARRVSEFRICVQEAFLSLLPVALLSSIIIVLINGLNIFLPNQYLIPDTLLVEAGKIPALIYPLALTAALSYYLSGFFEVDRVSGVLLALTTYLIAQQLVGNGAQETSFNASLTVMILPILMLRIFATMSRLLRSVARQHAQGAVFQPVTLIVPLTLTILIGAALIYPLYHLVEALTQGIDTTTAVGRMLYGQLAVFAEFERESISERTKAGMEAARKRGAHIGRPRALSADQAHRCVGQIAKGRGSHASLARKYGVSVRTLRRAIRDLNETCQEVPA